MATMNKKVARVINGLLLCVMLAACGVVPICSQQAYAYEEYDAYVAPGHGTMTPQYLVIHETANPGATAWNHVQYWTNNPAYATHYVMDLDGSVVYHIMDDWTLGWHVGNGNYCTVGIELCHATNVYDFTQQWQEAVAWAGDWLNYYGWGVDRMLSHNECRWMFGGTDHTDPIGYFAEYNMTWEEFEADVKAYMENGYAETPDTSAPAPSTPVVDGSDATYDEGFGGTYYCNVNALNVRDSIWGNVVAQYGYGKSVILDDWYSINDGMVWGRYTSYSGYTRYIAVGPYTGSPEADDYLVKDAYQAPASKAGWKTVTADALNIRDAAWGNVVGTYYYGQSVYIEDVVTASDGTQWGKYTAYSGYTRYVSMDWLQ